MIAGPGSGKTFVLVERILFLILEQKVPPSEILVLTFSKAAAVQMQERFLKRVREIGNFPNPDLSPDSFREVTFGTFHSVFLSILKSSSLERLSILDSTRSRNLLSTLFERYYHRPPQSEELTDLSSLISRSKSSGEVPTQENFRNLLKDYETYLQENSLLDFEDMIVRCIRLLDGNPELLSKWQARFRFLLIDEFQDINREQFEGIRLLAGENANLFAVGDDDQSIYKFRGADVRLMIDFPQHFPGTRVIHLDINYRSYAPIVSCGQRIIEENKVRLPKKVVAARLLPDQGVAVWVSSGVLFGRAVPDGVCVRMKHFETEKAEYLWIAERLREASPEERSGSAVIVRSHTQMQGVLRILEQETITFCLQGAGRSPSGKSDSARLLQKKRDLLFVIKTYYRLSDELSSGKILRRDLFLVMNRPERFLLREKFREESYTKKELLQVYPDRSAEGKALGKLCRDLQMLERLSPEHSLALLHHILGDQEESAAVWKTLLQKAAFCGSMAELRRRLDNISEEELPAETKGANLRPSGVHVLTMHASKGLEYDTVYLPDLNEGIFPGRRAVSAEALEEERRLFYVAVTRARDRLHLLYLRGSRENPRRPSRFLEPLGVKTWKGSG